MFGDEWYTKRTADEKTRLHPASIAKVISSSYSGVENPEITTITGISVPCTARSFGLDVGA
jgi:hypothetical protein